MIGIMHQWVLDPAAYDLAAAAPALIDTYLATVGASTAPRDAHDAARAGEDDLRLTRRAAHGIFCRVGIANLVSTTYRTPPP